MPHTVHCSVCGYEMQTTAQPTDAVVRCGACYLEQAIDSDPFIERHRHDGGYSPFSGQRYDYMAAAEEAEHAWARKQGSW